MVATTHRYPVYALKQGGLKSFTEQRTQGFFITNASYRFSQFIGDRHLSDPPAGLYFVRQRNRIGHDEFI